MGRRCQVEPGGHNGLPCSRVLCRLHPSGREHQHRGHCEATMRSLGLRSVQLEQTKLRRTNSISLDLLAPERKNMPDGTW